LLLLSDLYFQWQARTGRQTMELQVPMQMGGEKTDLWVVVAMPVAHKLATSLAD
jgi:hypothetical protein